MRWLLYLVLPACSIGTALSCAVGESYDQLIAEKGKPASRVEAGPVQILSYPDAVIKLRDNVVVSVRAPEPAPSPGSLPPLQRPSAASIAPWLAAPVQEIPHNGSPWGTDYDSALGQAKNEQKHTLLFFTGSDWCGWCQKLHKEILRTGEFARYAQEKLVLVELDYPRHKPQSDELKVQNHMLAARYNITGFPTVIILDSAGKAVARMGYQEGGPEPFLARIKALGD